jgi:uncharacterized protein
MTRDDCSILLNGETLVLDATGAAFWPAGKTLVVADLHFEKGSAYARAGQLLPPYDTRATLQRLEALLAHFRPARVVALGDSFHDHTADNRLDGTEVARLAMLTESTEWLWVEGNHDPKPPAWLGGKVVGEAVLGPLVLRHIPAPLHHKGEVAGHLHPCITIRRNGLSVRRRCYLSDGERLVLPAFGAYTGGLDVRDRAVTELFEDGFAAYALGRDKVYAVHARLRKKKVESQPSRTAIKTVAKP